jgi:hypothetical protein
MLPPMEGEREPWCTASIFFATLLFKFLPKVLAHYFSVAYLVHAPQLAGNKIWSFVHRNWDMDYQMWQFCITKR